MEKAEKEKKEKDTADKLRKERLLAKQKKAQEEINEPKIVEVTDEEAEAIQRENEEKVSQCISPCGTNW